RDLVARAGGVLDCAALIAFDGRAHRARLRGRPQVRSNVMVTEPSPPSCLREDECSILCLLDPHQEAAAILAGKCEREVGIHLHEEVPALTPSRVQRNGVPIVTVMSIPSSARQID
ncbi:hypothetical protein, partial [Embleya sp. NPDC059259]|uniref:hypothetical protein n=1 Tax=Embleya sp. NPDC059259 TaxID=3346796 RepID=UPI0036AFF916